jgi:hypothetical protein
MCIALTAEACRMCKMYSKFKDVEIPPSIHCKRQDQLVVWSMYSHKKVSLNAITHPVFFTG